MRFVITWPQLMRMNLMQQVTNRFLACHIPEAIWGMYFKVKKMFGISEPDFLCQINGIMVCLTCAILSERGKPESILKHATSGLRQ